MFDRQRLADILRSAANGDTRDLAEEVVRLMGAGAEAGDELRRARSERNLWQNEAKRVKVERDRIAEQAARALAAMPKTRRAEFAELAAIIEADSPT